MRFVHTFQLDNGIYSLAMLAALHGKSITHVPKIATQARRAGIRLSEGSYTILIQVHNSNILFIGKELLQLHAALLFTRVLPFWVFVYLPLFDLHSFPPSPPLGIWGTRSAGSGCALFRCDAERRPHSKCHYLRCSADRLPRHAGCGAGAAAAHVQRAS